VVRESVNERINVNTLTLLLSLGFLKWAKFSKRCNLILCDLLSLKILSLKCNIDAGFHVQMQK